MRRLQDYVTFEELQERQRQQEKLEQQQAAYAEFLESIPKSITREEWLELVLQVAYGMPATDVRFRAIELYGKAQGWIKQQDMPVGRGLLDFWLVQVRAGLVEPEMVPPMIREQLASGESTVIEGKAAPIPAESGEESAPPDDAPPSSDDGPTSSAKQRRGRPRKGAASPNP